jgi:hypothetical protein
MSSSCTCIAAPLSPRSQMKTRRSIRIDGVLTRPGDRSAGRSCLNGSGMSASNWGSSFILTRCASPNLLLPSHRRVSRLPRVQPLPRLRLDMVHRPRRRPGKWVASRGKTFLSSPMGRCGVQQAGRSLRRSGKDQADGSLRVVYAASIRDCRPCPQREQCQWQGNSTKKPRQVSVLLHPLVVGEAPLLWRDWSRRVHRRACIQLVRQQHIEVGLSPPAASPPTTDVILSRAQRAHSRLSWAERLARNARPETAGQVTIRLFGVPAAFATSLGLATA